MLDRKVDFSLKNYNTFGIDVKAKEVLFLTKLEQIDAIDNLPSALFLGGGSNVLFTQNLSAKVIINQTKGIEVLEENENDITLRIASGENWHELVLYCVENNYGGIENMSLIPGSVGAAPMQNIGAYGSEIKDVLLNVEAVHLQTKERTTFSNAACQFGYRESIFKKEAKNQYFISGVTIKLTKKKHVLNTSYGAIADVLEKNNIAAPTIKDVSDAVIAIRQSKLPDPKELGNAGSFFKNPIIEQTHFERLKKDFPGIKSYHIDEQQVKIPAGWLIESLGWKGKRIGETGSHKDQALVLVNYGNVQGKDVFDLSEEIKASVWDTYQIRLQTEVNII